MPYRRNNLRPINSDKHEVTWSLLGLDPTVNTQVVLAVATQPSVTNTATEVEIGSKISTIFLEFHFSPAQTGAVNVIHWQVRKEPFSTVPTAPNTYYQQDRRFIFKRGMEMLPTNVSTVFKRIVVVRIPPRFSRMGENDRLIFQFEGSSTQTINACGFAIYKRYS